MSRLKLNSSTIWIPISSTDENDFTSWLSSWKFVFMRSERFLFNTIAWNLSGFTIIVFILSHSIAILLSFSNLLIRSEIVVALAESALSSAKLWVEKDSIKKKRSLIEKLNRSGPTIDPCGTSKKLLFVLFIRAQCFRFFYFKAALSQPQATNLAIIKSWVMESNALEKSINNAPTM